MTRQTPVVEMEQVRQGGPDHFPDRVPEMIYLSFRDILINTLLTYGLQGTTTNISPSVGNDLLSSTDINYLYLIPLQIRRPVTDVQENLWIHPGKDSTNLSYINPILSYILQ